MIEIYGWMAVSETYGDEDAMSEAKLRGIMSDVDLQITVPGKWAAFRKFIYKKGSCTVKIDEDFSPCSPQIEE